MRWLQWILSQPVERGGFGMCPLAVLDLEIAHAWFIVRSESQVKKSCIHLNRQTMKQTRPAIEQYRDYMRELRKKYTGSEEL